MHRIHGEIFSLGLGEIESQLDDTISEQLINLSEEERQYVADKVDTYLADDCIYIDLSYNSWVLTLDFDSLVEAMIAYPELKLV